MSPGVAEILMDRPGHSLCFECLTSATGLRSAVISLELERRGAQVQVYEAACHDCRTPGPVFQIANGSEIERKT